MEDRQSTHPGRVKFTLDDGTVMYGVIERADEPSVTGTPLNKNTLFNSNNTGRYGCDLPSEAFELLTNEPVVTVPASGWSADVDDEGYYINEVIVEGMSAEYSPIFSVMHSAADSAIEIENAFSSIKRVVTYDGYIVCKSTKLLEIDLDIKLKGV